MSIFYRIEEICGSREDQTFNFRLERIPSGTGRVLTQERTYAWIKRKKKAAAQDLLDHLWVAGAEHREVLGGGPENSRWEVCFVETR